MWALPGGTNMTEEQFKQHHKDKVAAFDKALQDGRLSYSPLDTTYENNYMYMFTDRNGKDQFKHKHTGEWLP